MLNRNNTALGFLASAVLLSGSAFAFSPEFDDALPTVVITDKLEEPTNLYDPGQLSTQYLFRYTDAFNPLDYINLNGNDQNSVRFLFNEFDDASDTSANATQTLSINNTTSFATIPDASSFGGAPFLATSPAGNALDAEFRNIDFSPGVFGDDSPGTATGVVTGDDIDALGSQSRIVTLYIKSDDAPDMGLSSMLVVTKRENDPTAGDNLSGPFFSDPFSCVFSPSDLSGWTAGGIGRLDALPLNGPRSTATFSGTTFPDVAGFTNSPASPTINGGGTTAGGTMTLGMSSSLSQIGLANWALAAGSGASATTNNLYRGRATILSSNAATVTSRSRPTTSRTWSRRSRTSCRATTSACRD